MGSSSSDYANVMGRNLGIMPNAGSPPPVVQQSQPSTQTPSAPQQSPIVRLFQMLQNSMLGNGSTGQVQQAQPQPSVSPRDALIQSLMGGGYGR
jgi:hypothetical protein